MIIKGKRRFRRSAVKFTTTERILGVVVPIAGICWGIYASNQLLAVASIILGIGFISNSTKGEPRR